MDFSELCFSGFWWIIPLVAILCLWDVILKLLGMWKAAQRNELLWFLLIAIFNTAGILPLLYLLLSKDKKEE